MPKLGFFLSLLLISLTFSLLTNAQYTKFVKGSPIYTNELYDDEYHIQTIYLENDKHVHSVELIAKNANSISRNLDYFVGNSSGQKMLRVLVPYGSLKKQNNFELKDYKLAIHYSLVEKSESESKYKPQSAETSLLSTGKWYKISVPKEGLYKIDKAFLNNNGISTNNVNFQHLRIFGHGGTILGETVDTNQMDDLVENAIFYSSSNTQMSNSDYVLFYSPGPTGWIANSDSTFSHLQHYYENKSYYFISFDHGSGKKILLKDYSNEISEDTITKSSDYFLYHKDEVQPTRMGKQWYSDRINSASSNLSHKIQLPFKNAIGDAKIRIKNAVASNNNNNQTQITINNHILGSQTFNSIGVNYKIIEDIKSYSYPTQGQNENLQITYTLHGNSNAYLGFVEANYKQQIRFSNEGQTFRSFEPLNYTEQEYVTYEVKNANNQGIVWNISDVNEIYQVKGTFQNNNLYFNDKAGKVQHYISFSGSSFNKPDLVGEVSNQNLHGLPATNYLIITARNFLEEAENLAQFHREKFGTDVQVVEVKKIYNEFSSGSQDIAAIRNFIKHMYEKGENENKKLQNVLLFGAASFDYKNIISPNTNFVPTYQTLNSEGYVNTYPTDDFFAYLDHGEDIGSFNAFMDIGIGRIPATSKEEAKNYINKLKNYHSASSFGSWKMQAALVADDKELGMNHLEDCESISQPFLQNLPEFTIHKIYSDAHKVESGASGNRYPTMNQAINERIYAGTFYMSYSGHGSPVRWSHEAILTPEDYGRWTNYDALPLIITATCDFGRYDEPNPEERSAGTKIVLNDKGGAISIITTTQAVYANSSTALTTNLVDQIFNRSSTGKYKTLGEAYKDGKNTSISSNSSKFALLGDPGMQLAFPKHEVILDSIYENKEGTLILTDTLKALGKYKLKGRIQEYSGNNLPDFNGTIELHVYGQKQVVQTINDFEGTTPDFESQTNIIVNQKARVENGEFEIEIILPKDINFDFGSGKIALYAYNENEDAMGLSQNITIGGYSENATDNNIPPTVKVYLYDSLYHRTGFSDPNPVLFIDLEDDIGFNISGSSVGHDFVAILNEDTKNPIVLNSFFESSSEGPHKGYAYYPLYNLKEGEYFIRVRAWDVHNNMGEGYIRFEVRKQDEENLAIKNLANFPNPFKGKTTIAFEHNLKLMDLEVEVDIFSSSGALVKQFKKNINSESNKIYIEWDGKNKKEMPVERGIYFYRVRILHNKEILDQAYQKLLYLR